MWRNSRIYLSENISESVENNFISFVSLEKSWHIELTLFWYILQSQKDFFSIIVHLKF